MKPGALKAKGLWCEIDLAHCTEDAPEVPAQRKEEADENLIMIFIRCEHLQLILTTAMIQERY